MTTERIQLNVGGTLFETTRTTIAKLNSGYLNKLLDLKSGFQQPKDNIWFIDRDPGCFRIILNIARYGEVVSSNEPVNSDVLAKEADFYLLGSEIIAVILRYAEENRKKKWDEKNALLESIRNVSEGSLRELRYNTYSLQELVRGMASMYYWKSS